MSFDVAAEKYARFMGRFSEPLADVFVEHIDVRRGARALDVGCGTGALTQRLVDRLGAAAVRAVDPSESFVAATRARFPGVDVRQGFAEELPWPDSVVDVALAELVVHFMADPVQGLREMARVTHPGGQVAACVWDHAGSGTPLAAFWSAVRETDPDVEDESQRAGAREGHLAELLVEAGLSDVESSALTARVAFASFAEYWEPFTFGVGPSGAYVAALDDDALEELRQRCARRFPVGPFEVVATAWFARGRT